MQSQLTMPWCIKMISELTCYQGPNHIRNFEFPAILRLRNLISGEGKIGVEIVVAVELTIVIAH